MFEALTEKDFDEEEAKKILETAFDRAFISNEGLIKGLIGQISEVIKKIDGIVSKKEKEMKPEESEEPQEEPEDDVPEIECDVTVIGAKSPEELLEALNNIVGKSQKKEGEK